MTTGTTYLIELIIGMVITGLVVLIPYVKGIDAKVEAAVKAAIANHESRTQQVIAAINAFIDYVKQNPTQDAQVLSFIRTIAALFGISIPNIPINPVDNNPAGVSGQSNAQSQSAPK